MSYETKRFIADVEKYAEAIIAAKDLVTAHNTAETLLGRVLKFRNYQDDTFCGTWHIDDIKTVFDEHDFARRYGELTEEELRRVQDVCERKMDANIGMSWDVIATHMEWILHERESTDANSD